MIRVLLIVLALVLPVSAQEFSKENLRKTLEHITERAKQAEAAAAASEAAAQEAEKGRQTALGYVAEISNANTRLESELTGKQSEINAVVSERDAALDRVEKLRLEVETHKTAKAAAERRAIKLGVYFAISWLLFIGFFVARQYIPLLKLI